MSRFSSTKLNVSRRRRTVGLITVGLALLVFAGEEILSLSGPP